MANRSTKTAVGLRLSGDAVNALEELQQLGNGKSAVAVVEEALLEKATRDREAARLEKFLALQAELAPVIAAGASRELTNGDVNSALDETRDERDKELAQRELIHA